MLLKVKSILKCVNTNFKINTKRFGNFSELTNKFYSTTNITNESIIKKSKNENSSHQCEDVLKYEEKCLDEIESNLFANANLKYNPVKTTKMLNQQYLDKKQLKNIQKHEVNPGNTLKKRYNSRKIEDELLGISYTRLELSHPLLKKLFMKVLSRKQRDKENLILIEGRRLFHDALECGLHLETIIFSKKDQLESFDHKILQRVSKSEAIYKVPQHDLKTWSALKTPPGVIGIFKRPLFHEIKLRQEILADKKNAIPLTVVCSDIREPSNLGSIIRTVAAVSCEKIVVLKGCCDPWEPKALRSGCGGQFRVLIEENVQWPEFVNNLEPQNWQFLISESNLNRIKELDMENKTIIYSEFGIKQHCPDMKYILIIGGETHGISENIYSSIKTNNLNMKCLHIPLSNGIDSLNANAALCVILFEIKKYLNNLCKNNI